MFHFVTTATARAAYLLNALREAADMIPHLDAMTTQGVPSPEDRDTIEEEIDKAERRACISSAAACVLREVYGLPTLA